MCREDKRSGPLKRLATHGTGCRTDSEDAWPSKEPRHHAQGAQNTGKHQDAAKNHPCSATRRFRCGEEALVGEGGPDWDSSLHIWLIRHHTSNRLPRTLLKVFTAAKDAAITL